MVLGIKPLEMPITCLKDGTLGKIKIFDHSYSLVQWPFYGQST